MKVVKGGDENKKVSLQTDEVTDEVIETQVIFNSRRFYLCLKVM